MLGNFSCVDSLKNFFLEKKIFLELTLSECHRVWVQARLHVLSGLLWVQTVCKGYQQMTKVALSKERVECEVLGLTYQRC